MAAGEDPVPSAGVVGPPVAMSLPESHNGQAAPPRQLAQAETGRCQVSESLRFILKTAFTNYIYF